MAAALSTCFDSEVSNPTTCLYKAGHAVAQLAETLVYNIFYNIIKAGSYQKMPSSNYIHFQVI